LSRYKVTLVPQGVIPRSLELAVRMVPLPPEPQPEVFFVEEPPCVQVCNFIYATGWGSAGGSATGVYGDSTAVLEMQGGPWTLQLGYDGQACTGSVDWDLSGGTLIEGSDFVRAGTWLFGAKGCEPPYSGTIVVQATLDAVPWCDPMTINFSGEGGGCSAGGCFDPDIHTTGVTFDNSNTNQQFFFAGDPGLFFVVALIVDPPTTATVEIFEDSPGNYRIEFTNPANDATGAQWQVVVWADAEMSAPACDGEAFYVTVV
jgi:hypothetical protein